MCLAGPQRGVSGLASVLLLSLRLITGVPSAVAPSVLHKRSEPLLLTPYIKANRADTARRLALIKDLPGASPVVNDLIRSYSGYVTVNEKCQSNLFFWFFPKPLDETQKPNRTHTIKRPTSRSSAAATDSHNDVINNDNNTNSSIFRSVTDGQLNKSAPLVLWMQGGPGASSLFGLFVETGPFKVNMDLTLSLRKTSWLQHASLLYVDNPVGSGFSYTADNACYPSDQGAIGNDLVEFVRQFYLLFPELVRTPLYIGGQSYAGKYVPTLSYRLATDEGLSWVPLQGMILGNGFSDPLHMLEYGSFLEGVGLVNREQADEIRQQTKIARKMIRSKMFVEAYAIIDQLIVGAFVRHGTIIQNYTGINHYYNILRSGHPPQMALFYHYLHMERVKRAIHVGGRNMSDGSSIRRALIPDMMQSVASEFAQLLDTGYRVLFYSGQLDIIVNYVCVDNFFHHLPWSGAKEWRLTKRRPWRVPPPPMPTGGGDAVSGDNMLANAAMGMAPLPVAGYVRQVRNLTEVMIRNAGHIAPFDQPWPALDMFRRFITMQPFT